eukprot:TRINITY_DN92108_c0_g1_i1.p1 TRINITY_DN92108_c0_g1~~TRINITY_DN92108_c0_g1_i1.p1  ORF type:complete len:476 (+),score=93.88 TRINITY_DN92108_c0_g1_i1:32-1459(+)
MAGKVGIPPLRLNAGSGEHDCTKRVPQGERPEVSGSYSDDDFVDEEIECLAEETSGSLKAEDPPTRGRTPPNFPARPGSPLPPLQSPIASPDRMRNRNAKSCVGNGQSESEDKLFGDVPMAASHVRSLEDTPGRRMASAPELGGRALDLEEASEVSGPMPGEENDPEQEQEAPAYPSYSWRGTLARFPSLLRLYPLAAASEAALDDPASEQGGGQGSGLGPVDGLEGNEEYLNSHPGSAARGLDQPTPQEVQQRLMPELTGASPAAGAAPMTPRQPQPAMAGPEPSAPVHVINWQSTLRPASAGGTAGGALELPSPSRAAMSASPKSAPARANWAGEPKPERIAAAWQDFPGDMQGDSDLALAWDEVERARRLLEQRERELVLREAAVRRAETRNATHARQLDEMRHRLEDYSEELEEGMLALTAQQSALREERRRAADMQARARRMFAAANRDEVSASKLMNRDWEKWSFAGFS